MASRSSVTRSRAALALIAALSLLVGCDVRRGDDPEPPPADIIARGPNPDYAEYTAKDEAEVDRLCREHGVAANDEFNKHKIRACVVRAKKLAIFPPNVSLKVRQHEWGHEWDLDHDATGHKWLPAQNLFAQAPPPVPYDWSRAFAKPQQYAVNLFSAR